MSKGVQTGVNDLQTWCEQNGRMELLLEWDVKKNEGLIPSDFTYGSSKKVWWLGKCGHSWEAAIAHRATRKDKCPFCSNKKLLQGFNDLQTKYPNIAKEWHTNKNGDSKPSTIMFGSHKKVWWKCSKGHEWETAIVQRTANGSGCPYCSGNLVITHENDLETLRPEIAEEWHPTKNGDLKPSDVKVGSNKNVWWRCAKGHEWQATINNRTSKDQGCPFCSGIGTSLPEQGIAFYLEQVCVVEQRRKLYGKEVDVYLPEYNIGIEYDGKYYHPRQKAAKEIEKDSRLAEKGITVIRIKESDDNIAERNHINYIVDKMSTNYEWALKQLCILLSEDTGEDKFKSLDIDVQRDRLKIRARLSLYCKENSLATRFPNLAREWNYDKNVGLTPELVSFGSDIRVWWKCEKGHEWQANVNTRSNSGSGCPFCLNKKAISGQNDLLTVYPEIAKEWHPTKNGNLKPSDVLSKSNAKVWWLCSVGHEWEAAIDNRTGKNKTGCPYCSNKKVFQGFNDFLTKFPDIAKEWHPTKNGLLQPSDVLYGSHQKVWWQCSNGHEWKMSLVDRSYGRGCPKCAKKNMIATRRANLLIKKASLSSEYPELVKEWNFEKNTRLSPSQVTSGSQERVWWKCEKGHEWETSIATRTRGRGCPVCSDKLPKKVRCIETNTVYASLADAKRMTGVNHIGSCCNGKLKTAGGYHWKFVD